MPQVPRPWLALGSLRSPYQIHVSMQQASRVALPSRGRVGVQQDEAPIIFKGRTTATNPEKDDSPMVKPTDPPELDSPVRLMGGGDVRVSACHPRASRSADKLGWMLWGCAKIACVSSTVFRPDDVFTTSTSSS